MKAKDKESNTMASSSLPFINQPIPARIAGFSLTATFFVLALLGLAHHNFRGEILDIDSSGLSGEVSSLRSQSYAVSEQQPAVGAAVPAAAEDDATSYYVFLAKYPLQSSFIKVYHTEVIVCPRENFSSDPSFLTMLDGLVDTLLPSTFDGTVHEEDATKQPFVQIEQDQWTKQTNAGCVQLGYGGANCGTGCCGSPSKYGNRNYALSSTKAVISNAVGAKKELYFYGVSGSTDESPGSEAGIGGEDAYKAVCHGHMNAIEMAGDLPKCVSDWSGRSYNPLTNNCNTFTSTVLKCVYGLSDAKPHLGVSDLRTVTCPNEKRGDGTEVTQCVIPTIDGPKLEEDEVVDKQSTISME